IFVSTPATDNVVWTVYYDGSVIASYRLDLIVEAEDVAAVAPVVTAIQEGKHFAAVEVTNDVNDSAKFSAVYTLKASEWNGDLHTFPQFTIEGVLDPTKLTLTVGDESDLNQVGWIGIAHLNGYPENVYAESTGTHIFFSTPATDNVVWTVYYDGNVIASYRLDLIVEADPVDPVVDYGSITVGPSSIVTGSQSYIQVTYGEALANADFALLGQDGQIIGASVKGSNGKALIPVVAPEAAGNYDVAALIGGQTVVTGSIQVIAASSDIWETWVSISETGTIVINFNEGIATKDKKYDGIVSVNGKTVTSRLQGDRNLVTDVTWDSLEAGTTTVFTIKGIIFPRLYPGYSFTFTKAFTK
ncbi:MAG: hypothetical protein LBT32_07545, partial [Peptococcaceae bacterium]|nr:hypothetical protein [Peptococcaceae bacterium]